MFWIVQNIYALNKLVRVLECMEISHSYIDFDNAEAEILKHLNTKTTVFGSIALEKLAKKHKLKPGVYSNDNYDYRIWSEKWNDYILNRGRVECFDEVHYNPHFFIRPCKDDKSFTGRILTWDEYCNLLDKIITGKASFPGSTPVVVCPVKHIEKEYRFIVVDGKVITGSFYKTGSMLWKTSLVEDEIKEFAQKMADVWCPSEAFVLDIFMSENKPYVGEMGTINACGFYDCDLSKIVFALENLRVWIWKRIKL